jgi:hypothetical protein
MHITFALNRLNYNFHVYLAGAFLVKNYLYLDFVPFHDIIVRRYAKMFFVQFLEKLF